MRSFALVLMIATSVACQSLALQTTTAAPTFAPTPTLNGAELHFDDGSISFDYPAGYQLHDAGDTAFKWYPDIDLGGDLVAGLGDGRFLGHGHYWRSFRILRLARVEGAGLNSIIDAAYAQPNAEHPWTLVKGVIEANGPVTVAGREAIQKSYRIYSGEPAYDIRDVWIPVGDGIYLLSFMTQWSTREEVNAFVALTDRVLASMEIKEE